MKICTYTLNQNKPVKTYAKIINGIYVVPIGISASETEINEDEFNKDGTTEPFMKSFTLTTLLVELTLNLYIKDGSNVRSIEIHHDGGTYNYYGRYGLYGINKDAIIDIDISQSGESFMLVDSPFVTVASNSPLHSSEQSHTPPFRKCKINILINKKHIAYYFSQHVNFESRLKYNANKGDQVAKQQLGKLYQRGFSLSYRRN